MNIKKISIKELKQIQTSRTTTTNEVDLYKNLIKEYGVTIPIVVDDLNRIMLGDAKYLACKELGIEEIPCLEVKDLNEKDLRIISIAETRATDLGAWDYDKLFEELKELGDKAFLTGFDAEEVKDLIDDELETLEQVEEVETPEGRERSFSVQGDIYLLGKHRLMCGDSTNIEDVKKLMNGEKADLMVTDPPYNINYEGTAGKIKNDNMSKSDFYNFIKAFYENAFEVMREGASYYIFHADSESLTFRGALEEVGFKISQCLIWVKNSFILSRQDYNWRHEPCLYGWKEGAGHYYIKDYTQDTVIETPKELKNLSKKELLNCITEMIQEREELSTIVRENKPSRNELHPTMKPTKLLARLITNSTKKDWKVIDLFGGSGSTLIACEQINRKSFLMEFDEKFVDVIVKRYMGLSKDIRLIRNGKEYSFEEIKENFEE